jgi:DUF1680 family protein
LRLRFEKRLGFLIEPNNAYRDDSARVKNLKVIGLLIAAVLTATFSRSEVMPVVAPQAQPFPLSQVRLLDGPFRDAMLRDQQYLLSLDASRLLYNFRVNVGLPADAKPYGGWEAPDCQLRGHAVGHYLSACSMMYASTGDPRFKQRVDYLVAELARCQSNSTAAGFHEGYLSAYPETMIDQLEQGKPVWAPWYTLHKIMAGLLDASQQGGNAQALEVLTNMANWAKFRVDRLTPQQMQRTLNTEQGGMAEVLASLYGVTGNTNYLQLAREFNHQRVLDPLEHGDDRLNGLHANTQIPKIIGIAREYEFTGEPQFLTAAETFWNAVALRRSYVIGGDSDREHFFPTNDFAKHLSAETAETCNTYNMLKLTREIFALKPSATSMDFYERAIYNDILASQDPDSGMFTYFMSLKPGHFKVYSLPENSFWCCVGTGMENHSKYGDTIYSHNADSLWVNLFIASELTWADKGISVRQETRFPESDTTVLKITAQKPIRLALKIRRPAWAVDGVKIFINGRSQKIRSAPGSYFALERDWRDGDTVKIQMPMRLHFEFLPNSTNEVALLYGPIVLAGELGTNNMPVPLATTQSQFNNVPDPAAPVFVCTAESLLKHVQPVSGQPLTFRTHEIGRPQDVTLIPFYQIQRERFSVYWKLLTEAEWQAEAASFAADEARRIAEEARVVDVVHPGEEQSETDHKMQGGQTRSGDSYGFKWRQTDDWLSYEVNVLPGQPAELVVSLRDGRQGSANFDLLVDGQIIAAQPVANDASVGGNDTVFPLTPELTNGKSSVNVKFVVRPGKSIAGLSGLRVLRVK